jgi:adenosylhomocysteine nucleosidase
VKVLVTFALENEFAPWRAIREFRAGKWGDADVRFAKIGNAEVGVLITGMGPSRARSETSKVSWGEYDSLNFCVSAGLAAALRPEYHVGQVLAARRVCAEIPPEDLESRALESSQALISFASECGAAVVSRFYCTPRVIGRAEEKKHLGASADAVEMESFGVLLQARVFGVPAVAIRAVSDTADEDLPLDFNRTLTPEGRVSVPRLLGQLAGRPQALPGLIKLGRQSKQAAQSLCQFLDRYILKVAETARPLESRLSAVSR